MTLAGGGGCKENERSVTLADVALIADLEEQLNAGVATITVVVSDVEELQDEVGDLRDRVAKLEAERG